MSPPALELDWFGHIGQAELGRRFEVLLERSKRRPLRKSEERETREIDRALFELRALWRARLRCELEGIPDALTVVRYQAVELTAVVADDPLRCLEPDDLLELRSRLPAWEPADDIPSKATSPSESPEQQ